MKIGMRTIKTALSATVAILIAQKIGLLYPAAAGIIAVLSVTNTKRSSFKTGAYRIASLVVATGIAYLCFHLLGYHAVAFGVYLLLFIPLAVKWNMAEGIPVSSVLVTHYLAEKNMSIEMIQNAFLLLFIGVGLALLANSYMPNKEELIIEKQGHVDDAIRQLLKKMAETLGDENQSNDCQIQLQQVKNALEEAESWARKHDENHLFSSEAYYVNYFGMRRMQVNSLTQMNAIMQDIVIDTKQTFTIQNILFISANTFGEENDGVFILKKIDEAFSYYQQAALPTTREEFENRARLYHLLNEFKRFIELKIDFSNENNRK